MIMIVSKDGNLDGCEGLISCQTLSWFHVLFDGERDAEKAFAFIRNCGFEALDYHFEGLYTATQIREGLCSPIFDRSIDEILEYYRPVREAIDSQGIVISQTHGISPRYLPGNPEMNEYLHTVIEKTLEVCKFLDCPFLVLHPVHKLSREENLELFRKLIPAASKTGVKICMENMFIRGEGENAPFYDADIACGMIDELNASAGQSVFGICYDTGHANITGRDFYEDVLKFGDRLLCLHIHENDGLHDQHLIPYTQKQPKANATCADWEGLYKGLAEIHYRGTINFETHPALRIAPPELKEDVLKLTASVGRYMRKRIKE